MQEYFVGWHQPNNGPSGCGSFDRCMISVNRLLSRKAPFRVNRWILDSGAFTRITSGIGHLPAQKYAHEINRWFGCGDLAAAVTQDWMCEEFVLSKTGLTIADHQRLTIERYDALLKLVDKAYLMPVLQGYKPEEYVKHLSDYGDRLQLNAWVGLGSVCKRNANAASIESVLLAIKQARPDLRLHGFGIKRTALQSSIVWDLLYSADSQAHGLSGGRNNNKYIGSNNPEKALIYASSIQSPSQMSIFKSL
jgi:hypothetical protein